MPTLGDVYRKFGETAEAAQLLETELGNILLSVGALEQELFAAMNPDNAADLLSEINASTLGQLLQRLRGKTGFTDEVESLLRDALEQRNRLSHSRYGSHFELLEIPEVLRSDSSTLVVYFRYYDGRTYNVIRAGCSFRRFLFRLLIRHSQSQTDAESPSPRLDLRRLRNKRFWMDCRQLFPMPNLRRFAAR